MDLGDWRPTCRIEKSRPRMGAIGGRGHAPISAPARASSKCGNLRLWDEAVARADAIQQLETGGERECC
jgi:hypothetical protein